MDGRARAAARVCAEALVQAERSNGAPGTATSPQKPKRPAPPREGRTAFVYYGLEMLERMKAEHPDWSLRQIGETCQRRWDALADEAKAPYVELAQADAKRYKAEAAAYLAKM